MNERSASSCGAKGQQRRALGQNAINGEKNRVSLIITWNAAGMNIQHARVNKKQS